MKTKSTADRDQLSREAVVRRALEIADTEGLEAVSIRRVAGELGVTPMALYWHVANKDELLAAMGDSLYDDLVVDVDPAAPWDEGLRTLLDWVLAAVRRHPGAVSLVPARILMNDKGRIVTEQALELLHRAGYDQTAALAVAQQLLVTVVALVAQGEDAQRIGLTSEEWDQCKRDKRAALLALPPQRYPHLVACAENDAMLSGLGDKSEAARAELTRQSLDIIVAGVRALAPSP